MQAEGGGAGRRFAHASLSDLYAADEVELLLEELRGLERPPRDDDAQDFEIAGSQTGNLPLTLPLPHGNSWSPGDDGATVRSWDSHPNYGRTPPPPPARIAPLYCRATHLATPVGALRLLIAICSLCCVWLEYAGGGAGLWLLPYAGRLRLLLATAIFSLMASLVLLFLDISRLVHLFPFNWAKLNAWLYICVGAIYIIAASLVLAGVKSDDYWWVSAESVEMLIAAGSFGLFAGVFSGIVALIYCYKRPLLRIPRAHTHTHTLSDSHTPSPPPSPAPTASRILPLSLSLARSQPAYSPVPLQPDPLPCSSTAPL